MPFPSTRVIHPDWSAHHTPVASGTLSGQVVITEADTDDSWSPDTGPVPGSPGAVIYDGPFRAQQLQQNAADVKDGAGQLVSDLRYLLVLEGGTGRVPVGATAVVLLCPDDTALEGARFTTISTTYASHRWERDVYAVLDLTNQEGGVAPHVQLRQPR